jgi:hypothetical protein
VAGVTGWGIIDGYLTAIAHFLRLGVEERSARANREVLG